MLYYALQLKPQWIEDQADNQLFVAPTIWEQDETLPMVGWIKNGGVKDYFYSDSQFISRKILEKYVDFDNDSSEPGNCYGTKSKNYMH